MKKKPYAIPESDVLDILYSSVICDSDGTIDDLTDYVDGGDPLASM